MLHQSAQGHIASIAREVQAVKEHSGCDPQLTLTALFLFKSMYKTRHMKKHTILSNIC